jgi:hypothetical protein
MGEKLLRRMILRFAQDDMGSGLACLSLIHRPIIANYVLRFTFHIWRNMSRK